MNFKAGGQDQSFVDSEVSTATGQSKPIAFCIADGGTLPNTADKRFPMFRLNRLAEDNFDPLARFLHYIAGDLRSTWGQLGTSMCHPFLLLSLKRSVFAFVFLIFALFLVSFIAAANGSTPLIGKASLTEGLTIYSVLSAGSLFVLASGVLLSVSAFFAISGLSIWRQWRVQARARLRVGEAEFRRDDWIDTILGLTKGSQLYSAMYASAPAAHHERP